MLSPDIALASTEPSKPVVVLFVVETHAVGSNQGVFSMIDRWLLPVGSLPFSLLNARLAGEAEANRTIAVTIISIFFIVVYPLSYHLFGCREPHRHSKFGKYPVL